MYLLNLFACAGRNEKKQNFPMYPGPVGQQTLSAIKVIDQRSFKLEGRIMLNRKSLSEKRTTLTSELKFC